MWAAIFPGQGSQHPGMGHFLFENFKIAKTRFEEASDVLHQDFKKLCFEGSEEELQLTANTQPALLLVSTVTYEVMKETAGFKPTLGAGHSVGEYAALVNSGVIPFRDAIKAVRARGEAMQSAVPVGEGGMCAVLGLKNEQVEFVCKWTEQESGFKPLEPANFNSPGQVVISGNKKAIEWLQANFKKEILTGEVGRAKFITLKVSAPFHCSMMLPAELKMRDVLTNIMFQKPEWEIVQNFSAKKVSAPNDLRENVIRQVSAPVRWSQSLEELKNSGIQNFVEIGCGRVLNGLVKKTLGDTTQVLNLNSLEELKNFEQVYGGHQ